MPTTSPDSKATSLVVFLALLSAVANAFTIKNGERFFLANDLGDLIIAKLTVDGYQEIDRCHLLEPTGKAGGRKMVWSHPAFANKRIYARNDREIICVSLAINETITTQELKE